MFFCIPLHHCLYSSNQLVWRASLMQLIVLVVQIFLDSSFSAVAATWWKEQTPYDVSFVVWTSRDVAHVASHDDWAYSWSEDPSHRPIPITDLYTRNRTRQLSIYRFGANVVDGGEGSRGLISLILQMLLLRPTSCIPPVYYATCLVHFHLGCLDLGHSYLGMFRLGMFWLWNELTLGRFHLECFDSEIPSFEMFWLGTFWVWDVLT